MNISINCTNIIKKITIFITIFFFQLLKAEETPAIVIPYYSSLHNLSMLSEKGYLGGKAAELVSFTTVDREDSQFRAKLYFRPESFYVRNLMFFNKLYPHDAQFYFLYTLDVFGQYNYGFASHGYNVVTAQIGLRNQGIWGDAGNTNKFDEASLPGLSVIAGFHKHDFTIYPPWIREIWLSAVWSDLLCLPFCNKHNITFGIFPFQLGRGISLGVSRTFAVETIGLSSSFFVSEYRMGAMLSGDLIEKTLIYNVYAAISESLSSVVEETFAQTRGQQYFHRFDNARGFGNFNYVAAARLFWFPYDQEKPKHKILIEPYVLYHHRELGQSIDIPNDARRDVFTIGSAGEFEYEKLGFGFDTSFNLGNLFALGIDRNVPDLQSREGVVTAINTRVFQDNGITLNNALDVPENQDIIFSSPVGEAQNGKIIGTNNLGTLINTAKDFPIPGQINRFRDPFITKLRGSMFVFDMGYYFKKPDFRVNFTAGFASGGNFIPSDGNFLSPRISEDFVSVNNTYNGQRIPSFIFAITPLDFSNIVLAGLGVEYEPAWSCRKWYFSPNVVSYWLDSSTFFAFDRGARPAQAQQSSLFRAANKHFLTEINFTARATLFTGFQFYAVAVVFLPGAFFKDISGLAASKYIPGVFDITNLQNRTGFFGIEPTINHDASFVFNFRFEYLF